MSTKTLDRLRSVNRYSVHVHNVHVHKDAVPLQIYEHLWTDTPYMSTKTLYRLSSMNRYSVHVHNVMFIKTLYRLSSVNRHSVHVHNVHVHKDAVPPQIYEQILCTCPQRRCTASALWTDTLYMFIMYMFTKALYRHRFVNWYSIHVHKDAIPPQICEQIFCTCF